MDFTSFLYIGFVTATVLAFNAWRQPSFPAVGVVGWPIWCSSQVSCNRPYNLSHCVDSSSWATPLRAGSRAGETVALGVDDCFDCRGFRGAQALHVSAPRVGLPFLYLQSRAFLHSVPHSADGHRQRRRRGRGAAQSAEFFQLHLQFSLLSSRARFSAPMNTWPASGNWIARSMRPLPSRRFTG